MKEVEMLPILDRAHAADALDETRRGSARGEASREVHLILFANLEYRA